MIVIWVAFYAFECSASYNAQPVAICKKILLLFYKLPPTKNLIASYEVLQLFLSFSATL